jgi:hypothetical protein
MDVLHGNVPHLAEHTTIGRIVAIVTHHKVVIGRHHIDWRVS